MSDQSPVTLVSEMNQPYALERGAEVLRNTPRVLRALLTGLSPEWTSSNEGGETWSAYDVLGHLIYTERAGWMERAELLLSERGARTFAPLDRTAMFRESEGKSLSTLLDEFDAARANSLDKVHSWMLTEREYAFEATHPVFGTVTLRQLMAAWVAHDLGHIAQIVRVMARQYREAVGPWRQFLSIMDR